MLFIYVKLFSLETLACESTAALLGHEMHSFKTRHDGDYDEDEERSDRVTDQKTVSLNARFDSSATYLSCDK